MRRKLAIAGGLALIALGVWAALALPGLEDRVESRFRGRLFAVPSTVYSGPLVLYPGLDVARTGLRSRLERLHYQPVDGVVMRPGEYLWRDDRLEIGRRAFRYPHRDDPGGWISLSLRGSRVASIHDASGRELPTAEIEPEVIAHFRDVHRQDRLLVALDRVPDVLVDAVLAIEDQSFYDHWGVSPRRIAGAFLANLRAGGIVQGGSTLTQQLVKNFYLTREREIGRKIEEALMALLLERNHTKDEILEAYLNEVYLGQRGSVSIHGVGEASRHYFGKRPDELSLSESALLAALMKGAGVYHPTRHPERARERRDLVLRALLEQGRVAPEDYEVAVAEDLGVRPVSVEPVLAPYFVEFLRAALADEHGQEILESEGLSIFSTLDPELQRQANRAVESGLSRLEADFPHLVRSDDATPLQAALIALAPRTGEILAMVGGRNFAETQFNRATQALRQPGSVFKPVVALASVSRAGGPPPFTLASILADEPLVVTQEDGSWTPTNYDGEFRGPVSLRVAIEQSLNVPVARLGLAITPERVVYTARRMGIESRLQPLPSLSLGAYEITPLEAVRAYAVLAAEGVVPVVRSYTEVLDQSGVLLERQERAFERAFDPEETWLVTSLLRGAVDRGTARGLRERGFRGDVAAKTGTTSGFRDAWFIGYTPDLVIGVWVGFDDGMSLRVPGAVAALPIFADLLLAWQGPEGGARFVRPGGLELVDVDPKTGLRAGLGCPGSPEVFLVGTAPVESCGAEPGSVVEEVGSVIGGALERLLDWLGGSR